ncbi:Methionine aminopeptidase [Acinetobacter baumannii]|nr:Methionine aminopeptidase [Acinetobacter baumannii]
MRASTVTIKTEQDLEKLRVSGRLAAQVLEMIGEYVKPGVTTEYLDNICNDYIVNTLKVIPLMWVIMDSQKQYVLQSMKWYVTYPFSK